MGESGQQEGGKEKGETAGDEKAGGQQETEGAFRGGRREEHADEKEQSRQWIHKTDANSKHTATHRHFHFVSLKI